MGCTQTRRRQPAAFVDASRMHRAQAHAVLDGHSPTAMPKGVDIARRLGNALVALLMPFSIAGGHLPPKTPSLVNIPGHLRSDGDASRAQLEVRSGAAGQLQVACRVMRDSDAALWTELRPPRRIPISARLSRESLEFAWSRNGETDRKRRSAAAWWARSTMAGAAHGRARRHRMPGNRPSLRPRGAAAAAVTSVLVPVVRRGDGNGLAFLRHHHERYRRAQARPRPHRRRTRNPRLRRARQAFSPHAAGARSAQRPRRARRHGAHPGASTCSTCRIAAALRPSPI
jgi:hypothetical protein